MGTFASGCVSTAGRPSPQPCVSSSTAHTGGLHQRYSWRMETSIVFASVVSQTFHHDYKERKTQRRKLMGILYSLKRLLVSKDSANCQIRKSKRSPSIIP